MILGLLSLVSCTEYDEVAMWNKNEDMGSRLAALEELCSQLNTNIVSLQQIVRSWKTVKRSVIRSLSAKAVR